MTTDRNHWINKDFERAYKIALMLGDIYEQGSAEDAEREENFMLEIERAREGTVEEREWALNHTIKDFVISVFKYDY